MWKKLLNYIQDLWLIATTRTSMYDYVLVDIELRDRKGELETILHYRAIGARRIEYGNARDLNKKDTFSKFPPTHAQMIVTLATIEHFLTLTKDNAKERYLEYTKKCTKIIRSR